MRLQNTCDINLHCHRHNNSYKLQILATNNKTKIVFFLVCDSLVSEFHVQAFRNTLSVQTSTRPMKLEKTECFETLEHKMQTPGNHPKERIQHSQHGEILKSRQKLMLSNSFKSTCMKAKLFDEDAILKYAKSFVILCYQEHLRSVLQLYKYLSGYVEINAN